ncbi:MULTISPECIES: hypothetical protein [unclassified Coleofasciculus]|uniref:hypothetical protein n=1 Tax=unclassified Coleofasciculus TaxID=2692782 RepID=UPI00187E9FB0|nr:MULTISPECIES: hypothetical protein [unclassified Coleofasciculus]MBE9124895.1 hypothetical protein [Coleofasciculus sp. LEGE 07081]MBE9147860.1 hypothetical protein [Coleofasciculus sp. LEGE 07092]
MNECPYELPITDEQESQLNIDCDRDYGLHPCCPGVNQTVALYGSPSQMVGDAVSGTVGFFTGEGLGIVSAFALALGVGFFLKSK